MRFAVTTQMTCRQEKAHEALLDGGAHRQTSETVSGNETPLTLPSIYNGD